MFGLFKKKVSKEPEIEYEYPQGQDLWQLVDDKNISVCINKISQAILALKEGDKPVTNESTVLCCVFSYLCEEKPKEERTFAKAVNILQDTIRHSSQFGSPIDSAFYKTLKDVGEETDWNAICCRHCRVLRREPVKDQEKLITSALALLQQYMDKCNIPRPDYFLDKAVI